MSDNRHGPPIKDGALKGPTDSLRGHPTTQPANDNPSRSGQTAGVARRWSARVGTLRTAVSILRTRRSRRWVLSRTSRRCSWARCCGVHRPTLPPCSSSLPTTKLGRHQHRPRSTTPIDRAPVRQTCSPGVQRHIAAACIVRRAPRRQGPPRQKYPSPPPPSPATNVASFLHGVKNFGCQQTFQPE